MKLEVSHGATEVYVSTLKLEAVKLITDRGVSVMQASRDLERAWVRVTPRWMEENAGDPQ